MTEKLYYNDPFLKEFTATVLSCEQDKGGWKVTLDRTAFYPTCIKLEPHCLQLQTTF